MNKKRKLIMIIIIAAIISVLYAVWCVDVAGPAISSLMYAGAEGRQMAIMLIVVLSFVYLAAVLVPLVNYLLKQRKDKRSVPGGFIDEYNLLGPSQIAMDIIESSKKQNDKQK